MYILSCRDKTPIIPESCFIAPNATIVGEVTLGENCSIWFNAVLRGDVNSITMGSHCNIQDNATVHCTYKGAKTILGEYVSVGHNAIIHGCTIEDNVLVGMGAIVMDHCYIEKNSLIAAGAVLLEGTKVEAGSIYAGVPAKKVKELSPDTFQTQNIRIAHNYSMYASWFKSPGK
jgi:carbonic anhydrase/acetyltransferase-like protein (isoleucine patch superfamily)